MHASAADCCCLSEAECMTTTSGAHMVSDMQALFEQAIEDKSAQHFPLLWRCYLSYELKQGHADAARRLLLRAIHTCPGAKALWLDGFRFLSDQVWQSDSVHSMRYFPGMMLRLMCNGVCQVSC